MKTLVILMSIVVLMSACGGMDSVQCEPDYRECYDAILLTCETGEIAETDCDAWCQSGPVPQAGTCLSEPTGSPECWCV